MRLGLVVDLDKCVGCNACAIACKQWNTSGTSGSLTDYRPYGPDPSGVFFNRIRHYETGNYPENKTVHFPMSCMHCEEAACVTVCPTGASYKREEDGIVLVDPEKCMGCNYCAWACPYGARELDREEGIMKKCTLCVDRIYDENLPEAERKPACVMTCPTTARYFGDFDDPNSEVSIVSKEREGQELFSELGYKPVNKYLSPRKKVEIEQHEVVEPDLVRKVKGIIKQLPPWLALAKIDIDNKNSFELSNGSQVKASSTSGDAGRSEALSLLVIDEAAHIDNLTELWTGLYPTISTGGRCIALSTPNGVGNWFHKTCAEAQDGLNKFFMTTLPWDVHPDRDQAWFEEETKNMSRREIAQELECNFNMSGETVFHPDDLAIIEANLKDPKYKTGFDTNFWIWG